MNFYEVKKEGATLGVVSSNDFRIIRKDKILCSNEQEGQYIIINNQLYRPIMLMNNLEPEAYRGKYSVVKLYQILQEDYTSYKQAEMEEKIAKAKKQNLE